MTTANKITITRILLVPFFVMAVIYYVRTGNESFRQCGLLAFAIAALLDGVDGYVARHYHQQSELGTMLDPLADKLLLVSAIVILSFDHHPRLGQIPLWLTATIIGRDLLLAIGSLVIRSVAGQMIVKPHLTGKVATVFQMVMICWILLRWDVSYGYLKIWILGAGVFTAVSALFYIWDGLEQLGSHPASSPAIKAGRQP